MKKLICDLLSLALGFSLAACSNWSVEIKEPEDLSTGSVDEVEALTPENSEEAKLVLEELLRYMDEYDEYLEGFYPLRETGIVPEARNLELSGDGRHFSYDLYLKNGAGRELTLPLKSVYFINGTEKPGVYVSPGGFCFPQKGSAAFTGLGSACFIDLESLEATAVKADLSGFSGDVWINGAVKTEEGCALLVTEMGSKNYSPNEPCETKLMLFGADGRALKTVDMGEYFTRKRDDYVAPRFVREMQLLDSQYGKIFMCSNKIQNLDNGDICSCYETYIFEEGSRKVSIYQYTEDGSSSVYGSFAVLFLDGKAESYLHLGDRYLCYIDRGGSDVTGHFSGDSKVTIVDDLFATTINIDFAAGNYSIEDSIEERHLEDRLAESPDGKYSLWSYARLSVGDTLNYNIAIKNNENGELRYFAKGGGMYGGETETGFLRNGDIYYTDFTTLKIYDPETLEVKFDVTENFPLGKLENEGLTRYLMTFRRNPEDFSYIVVYFEMPENCSETEVSDDAGWRYEYPFSYKIGFLDPEGNLTESYDTGTAVWGTQFGIQGVSMRYSPEKLTLIIDSTKFNNGFTGVFDMETKEFTPDFKKEN